MVVDRATLGAERHGGGASRENRGDPEGQCARPGGGAAIARGRPGNAGNRGEAGNGGVNWGAGNRGGAGAVKVAAATAATMGGNRGGSDSR